MISCLLKLIAALRGFACLKNVVNFGFTDAIQQIYGPEYFIPNEDELTIKMQISLCATFYDGFCNTIV